MESQTQLIVKRVELSGEATEIIDLDYERIFNDVPDNYEVVPGSERHYFETMQIIFTAKIRKINPPAEPFDIADIFPQME